MRLDLAWRCTLALLLLFHIEAGARAKEEKSVKDTLVMNRVFAYSRQHADSLRGLSSRAYFRYHLQTERRNFTLFFVPTMYYVAKGSRNHLGEIVGHISFNDRGDYHLHRELSLTTVRHGGHGMSVILPYLTPDIYGNTLFANTMLSPFSRSNRRYYRYRVRRVDGGLSRVSFRPRLANTQLVSGYAFVNTLTGRVERVRFSGTYDMLHFLVDAKMGGNGKGSPLLPLTCQTEATMKFLGNSIHTRVTAYYDEQLSPVPHDSLRAIPTEEAMDSVRPIPLSTAEQAIYNRKHDVSANEAPEDTARHTKKTLRRLADKAWDLVGSNLLHSIGASNGKASVSVSPLLNPVSLSYSNSRGLSYKLRIGMRYDLGKGRDISLQSHLGYNFRIKKLFYELPLRLTYNQLRDNYVELRWANGNRITNSTVLDMLRDERRDTVDFSRLDLDYFDDEVWQLSCNNNLSPHFGFRLGLVYHRRRALNRFAMEKLGKPKEYKSFAPSVQLTYRPFAGGPTLTANYERSLRRVLASNTEYERWEFDGVWQKRLKAMRAYNLRVGGGFYTNRSTNYFVDFDNFHENYLPGGYDDDWSGDFQLLNSQWYNASQYYLRANASYESPLLLLSWMPLIGRLVEREAVYASALHIEHTRPYFELGYGFTTRYVSVGLFASFLNSEFCDFGTKFSFELFRKW